MRDGQAAGEKDRGELGSEGREKGEGGLLTFFVVVREGGVDRVGELEELGNDESWCKEFRRDT